MNDIIIEVFNVNGLKRMLLVVVILWLMMLVAVMVDLWTGVERAKAANEYVNSGGFRRTFTKVGDYWRVLAMLFIVDVIGNIFPWYSFPYASILGTMAVIAIEFRSVIENLREKHSAAANIPDMIKQIVQCKDVAKAAELLQQLKGIADTGSGEKTASQNSLGDDWQDRYPQI